MKENNVLPKKLYRVIVIASETGEYVFFDGKLVASGIAIDGTTVASLAEDRGLVLGQYFVLVVGLPIEYPLGDELTQEDYLAFGLAETY